MTHKENWLEKEFDFEYPVSRYVEFLQFLRETPTKLETAVKGLPKDILTRHEGDSWSIQENAGHFLTLEDLFQGRLDDYENQAPALRPARFEDNLTDKANYDAKDIHWILSEFRKQRESYIRRLDALKPDDFGRVAFHPRLKKPMRLCDMLQFHAEHDRHHLIRIDELKELWEK